MSCSPETAIWHPCRQSAIYDPGFGLTHRGGTPYPLLRWVSAVSDVISLKAMLLDRLDSPPAPWFGAEHYVGPGEDVSDDWKETQAELHRLVGESLHIWSMLDRMLFRIFLKLLGINEQVAGTIFFRFAGTGTRLALVSDVLNLAPEAMVHRARWNSWKSQIEPLLKIRDLVAHNPVSRKRTIRLGPPPVDEEAVDVYLHEMSDIALHKADNVNARKKVEPHDLDRLKVHVSSISDQLLELYEIARLLEAVPPR